VTLLSFIQEPQRAHHVTVVVLDPQVQGLRVGVASIDVGVRADLFDDEDVLTHRENPEQGSRRQLVEVSRTYLRHALAG